MKKQQRNWYSKVKNRLHLDEKCRKTKAEYIVQEDNVPVHTFFPFIHFQLKQFKLSKKLEQKENEQAESGKKESRENQVLTGKADRRDGIDCETWTEINPDQL